MGAIVAATLTAAGSAIVAALQARTLHRESDVLRRQWDIETGFRWPKLRRDAAHAAMPAPIGMFGLLSARQQSDAAMANFDPAEIDDDADTVLENELDSEFNNEPALPKPDARPKQAAAKVPVESLQFAPFLLDSSARTAWAILFGVLTLVSLVGPQFAPGLTQVGALLIPLTTLALAALYPMPWAWAMVIVAWLQGANAWGYSLAGGSFQPGDAAFCVAMYLANAAAVSLVAAATMNRHRRWIVMRAE